MRSRARPHCPECDAVVIPRQAQCITLNGSRLKDGLPRRNLVGVYCCGECAIDAWFRGFPYYRIVGEAEE